MIAEPTYIAMHPALVPAFKDWLADRHGIRNDHPGMGSE